MKTMNSRLSWDLFTDIGEPDWQAFDRDCLQLELTGTL